MSQKEKKPPFKKLKVFFHSCHSRQLSGFGKNCKNVLSYLHSTGKYEIVEYANAYKENDASLKTLPWKCIGSGPSDDKTIIKNNEDPSASRRMSYGLMKIDEAIKREKPDVYIGAEDIWALMELTSKPWWNKINCMIWTTLDSLPIFPEAIEVGASVKNYYTWASFASEALIENGISHAKCLHGAIDITNFKKLDEENVKLIKAKNNINSDFVVGFVFRNQLRKSVPSLLQGFKLFKDKHKNSNAKLLLHTGWHEGWDIPSLIKENQIEEEDVLTTYICNKCSNYSIKSFRGQTTDCEHCKTKNSQSTISVSVGPTEKELNEIYNIMDVYCHPFTSGGQEIPIQEAKLTELITLSTNYSCGTDMAKKNSGGFTLDWSEYREANTQFIKASTCPKSICKNLSKVYTMDNERKKSLGKTARDFVIKNYSKNAIGKKLETILDNFNKTDFDFKFTDKILNKDYVPKDGLNDLDWILDIYKNMLGVFLKPRDKDAKHWQSKLNEGMTREFLYKHLKSICIKETLDHESEQKLKKILKGNEKEFISIACYGNDYQVLLISRLIKNIIKNKSYKNKKLLVFMNTQYAGILFNNKNIHKILPLNKLIESENFCEQNFFAHFKIENTLKSSGLNERMNAEILQ